MSSISVDYDVLNQKGSPAWYSDTFANIPTPGYKGRMFISTDTFAFYRDNGVGWDLVGGPGTGTITGAGVFGQVTFFSGTDTISGNTDFVWDNTNKRLGINTATPGAPLDIHSTGTAAQFNGTGVNNSFVLFQNAGSSKWRIGNLYNSGANDYQIFDVTNSTARLTIKNTGASTLIGTFTATSLIKSGGTSSQILLADGTTTPTSTFGAGSVTNVSAITLGTSGTDLTSSVANSTTTPVITLNVPTASATNRGALSSADWTTFNSKQATITLTTTGTSGAATLVGATLNIPNYTNVGTVTSVAALTLGTTGTDLSSTVANSTSTPVITLNVPTASATNRGALSSADWTTFNNKQGTISVTAPVVLTGATISMPAATTSVSGYLTSTDWNTFNNKTSNLGTVTDVVALTIGTTGIDITSTAVTTTTTPVITLNIPTASASNRGALSSTDWTTFNNKQATLSLTTTGTSGAATLVANTLNVPDYGSALSGYLPLTGGTLTGGLIGTTAIFSGLITEGTTVGTRVRLGTGTPPSGETGMGLWATGGNLLTLKGFGDLTIDAAGSLIALSTSGGPISMGGALSGTSATFSGTIQGASLTDGFITIGAAQINRTSATVEMQYAASGNVRFFGNGTYPITFTASTGAATFSSTLTATNITNNGIYYGRNSVSYPTISLGYFALKTNNLDAERGGITIQVSNSTSTFIDALIITYGGDASFSNDVNASGKFKGRTSGSGVAFETTNGVDADFTIETVSGGTTKIGTSGNKLAINSGGGFVSIGKATNQNKILELYQDTNAALRIQNSATGTGNNDGFLLEVGGTDVLLYNYEAGKIDFGTNNTARYTITSAGINNYTSRGNYLGATDNALFSLNSGGTLYTVGFSPTATASSTNTFTLTTGTTTWIYTGTGVATWTLPNPSGNNQIYWIKNAGTGAITLTAFSGTNIINNSATSVGSITIAVGATAVIAQDGNVKSYQLQ